MTIDATEIITWLVMAVLSGIGGFVWWNFQRHIKQIDVLKEENEALRMRVQAIELSDKTQSDSISMMSRQQSKVLDTLVLVGQNKGHVDSLRDTINNATKSLSELAKPSDIKLIVAEQLTPVTDELHRMSLELAVIPERQTALETRLSTIEKYGSPKTRSALAKASE